MPRTIVNAVLVRGGTVLLARRAAHRRAYAGLWSFPGGHVEPGEALDAALRREAAEEIGVTPTAFRWLGTIADPPTEPDPATYHTAAVTAWMGGEPALRGDEHAELRWFGAAAADALPDLALDAYRAVIAAALA